MNPFVGLRPFEQSESHLFFGRKRETKVLLNLVLTLPVIVVYARSGTGKSSILNAGVGPQLVAEGTQLPIFLGTDQRDVTTAVRQVLTGADLDFGEGVSLRDILHQYWLKKDKRAVVILDQFEERLNSGIDHTELYAAIAHLANESSDAACIVISIREDYLGALEPLMRRVPNLLAASYRVPPLSREALEKAIYGPLSVGVNPQADEALATATIDDLHSREGQAHLPGEQAFEPGYFQIIWSTLWEKAQQEEYTRLTLGLYRKLGGASSILRDFTTETLGALEPAQAHLFWAMSRYLVLPTGAKIALTVDDIVLLLNKSDYLKAQIMTYAAGEIWISKLPRGRLEALVRQLLGALTSSRTPLFQRVMREDREEFELLHDLLASILLQWRSAFEEQFGAYCTSASASIRQQSLDMSRDFWNLYSRPSPSTRTPTEDRGEERMENDDDWVMESEYHILPEAVLDPEEKNPGEKNPGETKRLFVQAQIIKQIRSLASQHERRLAEIETRDVTASELQELVREGNELRVADGVMNSSDWGYSPHNISSKYRVGETLDSIAARMLWLALDHPSQAVRRAFQEQLFFWSPRVSGVSLSSEINESEDGGISSVVIPIAIALVLACLPLLAGNWAALTLLSAFRLQYTWLSIGIVSLAATALYSFVLDENHDSSDTDSSRGLRPWTRALRKTCFPAIANPSEAEASGSWISRARILGSWPVPPLTCVVIAALGALFFRAFDFSPTAGFNVGLLIGSIVGGLMLIWTADI